MLLYLSENKMHNLLLETEINMNFTDLVRTFSLNNININAEKDSLSADIKISPFRKVNKESKDMSYVLKTLKRKGKLQDLSPDLTIVPLSYIISRGTLEYVRFEDGHTACSLTQDDLEKVRWDEDSFFDDDKLIFEIKIGHNNYDRITIKCTASNIKVFGGKNLSCHYEDLFKDSSIWLRYPHSGDPGILYRKISVEFIIWILDTDSNNRNITGSPVIIYC